MRLRKEELKLPSVYLQLRDNKSCLSDILVIGTLTFLATAFPHRTI